MAKSDNSESSASVAELLVSEKELTPFVGREIEQTKLLDAFINTVKKDGGDSKGQRSDCSTRMTIITGCSLVGKSRFAVETAKKLQTNLQLEVQMFVHSVELRGLGESALVQAQMASALLPWKSDALQRFHKRLGSLEEWHVFILDGAEEFANNEHTAKFMDLCQEVIAGSSKVLIMVLSRVTFNFVRMMNQVLPIRLDPLSPCASRQLLVTMAPNVIPESEEGDANHRDVEKIIRCCGGIPFALELAGAEMRDGRKTVAEIAADLSHKHDVKAEGCTRCEAAGEANVCSGRARRVLEPLIGGALKSLSSTLRKHLAELAIIPSSFTDDAAAYITNIHPTSFTKRDLLLPLHSRSLVAVETLTNRFSLNSFLRCFIEERYSLLLTPQDARLVRGRYCGFYARLLQRTAELLEQEGACKSIPIFITELQNMQKLLQEALHCPEESYTLFIEVAYQARQLILQFIPNHDAIKFYEVCLEAAKLRKDKLRQARILISLGRLVRYVDGDMQYAENVYREALGLLAPSGDSLDHAATLSVLGFHFFDSAKPKLAISYQLESLAMIQRLEKSMPSGMNASGDHGNGVLPDVDAQKKKLLRVKAQTLEELACVHARLDGNLKEGIACHEESIRTQRQLWDDHLNIGQNLYCLAIVYQQLGRKDDATRCAFQSLKIMERLCTQPCPTLIVCYTIVAEVICSCQGDIEGALKYINKAWRVQEHIQTRSILRYCLLYAHAKILVLKGDVAKALKMYRDGYKIAIKILGRHLNTARALQSEGWAALQTGDLSGAMDALLRCLEMRESELKTMKWNVEIAETLETLGDVCLAGGDIPSAVDYYHRCGDALNVPIKRYTKLKADAAQEVRELQEMVSKKCDIVSMATRDWAEEQPDLMTKTVIYEYNYWPMT
ncbi:uncharacterized protein [Diadema antillarum]|uniref:uncharacterized protein n=1 Tax=Diadema antillarum TaxID=105358 RepID=UPI003A86AC3A